MTTATTYADHPDAIWDEVDEAVEAVEQPVLRIWGPRPEDADLSNPTCHCWRCNGGPLSLAERGPLDRILMRHLMREEKAGRENIASWLRDWAAIPGHSPQDKRALQTWLAIENGFRLAEPAYSVRRL